MNLRTHRSTSASATGRPSAKPQRISGGGADFGGVGGASNNKAKFALVVLVAVITAFILVISPLRNYFAEAHRVALLEQELSRAQSEKTHAEGESRRLGDSKFIMAYAREHYAMIMPGETAILIANPEVVNNSKDIGFTKSATNNLSQDAAKALNNYKTPWYEKIYNSLTTLKSDQNNGNK